MDEATITRYIRDSFDGVDVITAAGDTFFMYDPDHKFPFATIVTKDNEYDNASNLDRPEVFRLNIGVSKPTFLSLFAPQTAADAGRDFAALDRLMPHPVYGKMYWVSVINPTAATFEAVKPLLTEAYEMAVRKRAKPTAGG